MVEIEFLPGWYVRVLRERRALLLQAALTAAIALASLGWWRGTVRRLAADAADAAALDGAEAQARADLDRARGLGQVRDVLLARRQALDALQRRPEAARLIAALAGVAPRGVSLTELTLDPATDPKDAAGALRALDPAGVATLGASPRARLVLKGLAPAEADVAAFQAALSRLPGVAAVALGAAKDQTARGHVLREFEVDLELASTP